MSESDWFSVVLLIMMSLSIIAICTSWIVSAIDRLAHAIRDLSESPNEERPLVLHK